MWDLKKDFAQGHVFYWKLCKHFLTVGSKKHSLLGCHRPSRLDSRKDSPDLKRLRDTGLNIHFLSDIKYFGFTYFMEVTAEIL